MPIHTSSASVPRARARVSYRFLFPRCVYCILARVQFRKLRDEGLCLFVSGTRLLPVWQIAMCKVSHCHSALKLLCACKRVHSALISVLISTRSNLFFSRDLILLLIELMNALHRDEKYLQYN